MSVQNGISFLSRNICVDETDNVVMSRAEEFIIAGNFQEARMEAQKLRHPVGRVMLQNLIDVREEHFPRIAAVAASSIPSSSAIPQQPLNEVQVTTVTQPNPAVSSVASSSLSRAPEQIPNLNTLTEALNSSPIREQLLAETTPLTTSCQRAIEDDERQWSIESATTSVSVTTPMRPELEIGSPELEKNELLLPQFEENECPEHEVEDSVLS